MAPTEHPSDEDVGVMAIEVRTALNAIIGLNSVLLSERFGPLGDERYRAYVRDIDRSGRDLLAIVDAIMARVREGAAPRSPP